MWLAAACPVKSCKICKPDLSSSKRTKPTKPDKISVKARWLTITTLISQAIKVNCAIMTRVCAIASKRVANNGFFSAEAKWRNHSRLRLALLGLVIANSCFHLATEYPVAPSAIHQYKRNHKE